MYSEYDFWYICLIICPCVVDFMRFKFFLGSTRGETLWRKHLSSVPWVCLATWQIQRQWNLWILWMSNQKVRVHSLSGTVLFSCISRVAVRWLTELYTCLYFLYRSWHGVSSLPLPRWLVVQILCWPLLRSKGMLVQQLFSNLLSFCSNLMCFFLPLCVLTTSPLGNQSFEHRQNALQDPLHRVCWSSPQQNREKNWYLMYAIMKLTSVHLRMFLY